MVTRERNEKHIWCKFRAKILGYSCCKPSKRLVEGKTLG